MIQKLLILIIFLSTIVFSQNKVLTQFYFDDDNEGQNTYKYYIGYSNEIKDNLELGIMGGFRNYIMPNLNNNYADIRPFAVYNPFDNLSIKGNLSFLLNNGWKPIFYDVIITYSPIDLLYFEGYVEHESVGSALTNEHRYISTISGVSMDINPTNNITFSVGFSYNTIAETDIRTYQTYRAIYTMPFEWMFVDLKAKIMLGGDYNPYYFSPSNFGEYNGGIGINIELFSPQYYMRFYTGGGVQTVNDDVKGLFISNIRLFGDFTPEWSTELTYGISNSSHNAYGSYLYNYGQIQINYRF